MTSRVGGHKEQKSRMTFRVNVSEAQSEVSTRKNIDKPRFDRQTKNANFNAHLRSAECQEREKR